MTRKIHLFICFLLLNFLANSQETTQNFGGPTSAYKFRGRLYVDSILQLPGAANFVPLRPGAIRYIDADSATQVWTGYQWLDIGATAGATWGAITGTLSDQADLQTALNAKQNTITLGTASQYFKGNLSLGTFNTDVFAAGDTRYLKLSDTSKIGGGFGSDTLFFEQGLKQIGNKVVALNFSPMWNASRVQGYLWSPAQPPNGTSPVYNASAGMWEFDTVGTAGGGPVGPDSTFANYNLTFTGDRAHDAAHHSLTLSRLLALDYIVGDGVLRTRWTADSTYTQFNTHDASGEADLYMSGVDGAMLSASDDFLWSTVTVARTGIRWDNGEGKYGFDTPPADDASSDYELVYNSADGNLYKKPLTTVDLSNYYTKTESDGRYLQAYTETDPKRVTAAAFTGTTTKTLTLTLADASTVTASFSDNEGSGGSTRFGVSGEDATAAQNRTFTYTGQSFVIQDLSNIGSSYWRSRSTTWTSDLSFGSGSMGITTNDYPNYDYQAFVGTVNDGTKPYVQLSRTGADGSHYIQVFGDQIKVTKGASTTLKFIIEGLQTFADNSAATTGGLPAGALYRTSTGVLMVRY